MIWLLSIALVSMQWHAQYLAPDTEFPTEAACEMAAAAVRLDLSRADQRVLTICDPHRSKF